MQLPVPLSGHLLVAWTDATATAPAHAADPRPRALAPGGSGLFLGRELRASTAVVMARPTLHAGDIQDAAAVEVGETVVVVRVEDECRTVGDLELALVPTWRRERRVSPTRRIAAVWRDERWQAGPGRVLGRRTEWPASAASALLLPFQPPRDLFALATATGVVLVEKGHHDEVSWHDDHGEWVSVPEDAVSASA